MTNFVSDHIIEQALRSHDNAPIQTQFGFGITTAPASRLIPNQQLWYSHAQTSKGKTYANVASINGQVIA